MISRVLVIVLDGLGVGELPDAGEYGDEGSFTLGNISKALKGIDLPNLEAFGLGNIAPVQGIRLMDKPLACFGKMNEKSAGKDTITGHWEMAGLILNQPFPLFCQGFPEEIINSFEKAIGRKVIGNKAASGTIVIEELGEKHLVTGRPIVYTSADSVFQIAAHEEVVGVEILYKWCEKAREILKEDYAVGRVIARPFKGVPGAFTRTTGRKDYPLKPFEKTILDYIKEKGHQVISIGKIYDIFAGFGITQSFPTKGNKEGLEVIKKVLKSSSEGLVFANLVDFDMLYGHRNDPEGYYMALREFDDALPDLCNLLSPTDMIIITADHGCDPTMESTDHTREYVPLLVYGKNILQGVNLGVRETFADVAATLSEIFKIEGIKNGTSFAKEVVEKAGSR
ncbi:phosphopentomutase [Candidatus Contubernalis alkaliaceticus]|uniref:phosphopentomutase n=1 Tax=Candidatus Contubernalis alkaliaceticus TaxID=338645 RepID=UPI001F4C4707|nr:phosphopentomutase [Candidatus Contubernalis alkalaceticus]UNC92527.1 phosphopentomutase [Candidatus Contubernalis alkalaceticus]